MRISDLHFPEDLRYDLQHLWVRALGDEAVLGITDYAQSLWGDVGFVQLPGPGMDLRSGQAVGQVSCALAGPRDLFTPLTGAVIAANEALTEDPSLINADPYGEGWLLRLDMADPAELRDLLDAGAYRSALQEAPPDHLEAVTAAIFQHSVDPMLLIDRHRRVVAMNPAAERLTGCEASRVIGTTHCFHLFRCEIGGETLHGIDCIGVAARENGISTGRYRIHHGNGATVPVSASYSQIPAADGGALTLITLRVLDTPAK